MCVTVFMCVRICAGHGLVSASGHGGITASLSEECRKMLTFTWLHGSIATVGACICVYAHVRERIYELVCELNLLFPFRLWFLHILLFVIFYSQNCRVFAPHGKRLLLVRFRRI